jgi:predicted Zn-dependent peptidase
MLEHLLFEQPTPGDAAFVPMLERLGGTEYNGETHPDRTEYFAVVPSHRLAELLWLESDRLGFALATLSARRLEAQRRVVQNEHRERVDDQLGGHFYRFITEALYPREHPMLNVFEHPDELAAITLPELQWFFQRWYVPSNVTLVLVGDFDPASARALVERYFGSLASGPAPARAPAPPPVINTERRIVVEAPVFSDSVVLAWATPGLLEPGDAALDVVAYVLSGAPNSRLDRRMQHDLDIASALSAQQESEVGTGQFVIRASAVEEHRADELLREFDSALVRIRTEPIPRDEFERARRSVVERVRSAGRSLSGRAAQLSAYARLTAGDPAIERRDIERYESLTPADTLDAARRFLAPNRRLVATLRHAYRQDRRGVLARTGAGPAPHTANQPTDAHPRASR